MIPKNRELEIPLLFEIAKAGGAAQWRTLFQPVAAHFTGLNPADLERPARLRWASYHLFKKGELSRQGGIWEITKRGRERLDQSKNSMSAICRCGCGTVVPQSTMYVPGHDAIHRSKLIEKAGGVDGLEGLEHLIDTYIEGEIGESDLAKGIRRLYFRSQMNPKN